MNRAALFCGVSGLLLGILAVAGGCDSIPDLSGLSRQEPVIIPTNPDDATLARSFTVDLGGYSNAERMNWDFGDGGAAVNRMIAEGQTVTHDYAASGTYLVTVHLFSAKDWAHNEPPRLLASASLPVDVLGPNQAPTAWFDVTDVVDELGNVLGLSRHFDAARSRDPDGTIETYKWDFGDGETGSGKSLDHAYAQSGRYVVRLIVVDDRGDKGTTTRTVLVNTPPVAQLTSTIDPSNAMRFTFDGSGSSDADGQIREYRWDFGDGSVVETGQTVVHEYTVPDNYTVELTVVDDFGATASASKDLDVTGSEPFVRSVDPDYGVVDTTVTDATIDGENFESGAAVRLTRGSNTITATSVTFTNVTTLKASFDLTGAEIGLYTVVVENPSGATASKDEGFRVASNNHVRLTTSKGDVLLELVDDAPVTTANFLTYTEEEFYDGTIFHRVIANFVVQGGGVLPDGSEKPGTHDPIVNEFSASRSNIRGSLAMAKLGDDPNSATSQFFVNLKDNSDNLDNQNGGFTVFAHVIEGMDVVDEIAAVEVDDNDRPVEDVLLIKARRE
jgi:cyclophilin family peptidyl-prolyl cis-trans isomerase/chitodextrinase